MTRGRQSVIPDLTAAGVDPVLDKLTKALECVTPGAPPTTHLQLPTYDGEDELTRFIQQYQDVGTESR